MHFSHASTGGQKWLLSYLTGKISRLAPILSAAALCTICWMPTPHATAQSEISSDIISPPAPVDDCLLTIGYWRNHPEDFPLTSLTLGTRNYPSSELLQILNTEPGGNGAIQLARQLIAVKLNIALTADASCITTAIEEADALLTGLTVPPIGSAFLHPSETSHITSILDQFNMGNSACGFCGGARTNVIVIKTAPSAPVQIGSSFQYMITACNDGMTTAHDVVVTDTLPLCANFVSAQPAPVNTTANPLRWNLGSLDPGQCRTIVVNVTADCDSQGCVNTATVSTIDRETDYNDNEDSATVTIIDSLPPDITCPPNRTLNCPADTSVEALGRATATDNCGNVTITHDDLTVPGCGESRTITRTWTATDGNGNTDTCVQTIQVRDNTPPTLTCPANITVSAPAGADNCVVVTYPPVTASDACGDVRISYSHPSGSCFPCGTVTTVNVTATDECGNTRTCSFTVTVGPCPPQGVFCVHSQGYWKTHPEEWQVTSLTLGLRNYTNAQLLQILNEPVQGNGLVSLAHQLIAAKLNVAMGADASCIAETIQQADALIGNLQIPPIGSGSLNPSETGALQNLLEQFNEGRSACGQCVDTATTNVRVRKTGPTAPVNPGSNFQFVIEACNTGNVATRDVVVTDTLPACATFVSATPAPVNPAAVPLRWQLGTLQPGECRTITINATASCAQGSCVNTAHVSTTDRESDYSDNQSSASVVLNDNTPPTITCPPNRTVDCGANTSPGQQGTPTATDNCGTPTVTFTDAFVGACGDTGVITRTWTATDGAGNTASCTQRITIRDNTPPALTCPANISLPAPSENENCVEVDYPAVSATDACGTVDVVFNPPSGTCFPCGTVTTVNVTATDECGNTSTCTFTVTIAPCQQDVGCGLTQGYWKNHTDDWPVTSLTLGTRNYSNQQLVSILQQPVKGNSLIALAHQLIAAKLNIANGADDSCVSSTIVAADALISNQNLSTISGKYSSSEANALTDTLDRYNNGFLCVPHCHDEDNDNDNGSIDNGNGGKPDKEDKKAAKAAKKAEKKAAKEAAKAAKQANSAAKKNNK